MTFLGLIRLVTVGFVVIALAVPAAAQVRIGDVGLEGNVEAGWRFFVDEPPKSSRAKWEEYRDYPGSAFLGELRLRFFTPDEKYSLELEGANWGQLDQYFGATATRLGVWQFGFSWDQTPHTISTTAQLLASQPSPGIFVLPDPRPALFAYNAAPTLDKVAVRWDTAKVFFNYTLFPDFDIKAEYNRIYKSGEKPFGMPFGSPGNNFYEVLQPIKQTIHDFRLQGTWAREQWQLQFGYVLSVFENDLTRVQADNPCFGLTAAVAAGGCAGDATGDVGRLDRHAPVAEQHQHAPVHQPLHAADQQVVARMPAQGHGAVRSRGVGWASGIAGPVGAGVRIVAAATVRIPLSLPLECRCPLPCTS